MCCEHLRDFLLTMSICRPIGDEVVDFGILQDDLDRLSVWSRTRQLGISHDKCSLMRVNASHHCPLKIDGYW